MKNNCTNENCGCRSCMMKKNIYTKPEIRERVKDRIMAGGKGGAPGQWSARKAQMVARKYKSAGGGYKESKAEPQKSLDKWTDEEWNTKSGKPSTQGPTATGERYLPKNAIKALTPSEYRASTQAKREAIQNGRQFSKQPQKIANKTAKYQ